MERARNTTGLTGVTNRRGGGGDHDGEFANGETSGNAADLAGKTGFGAVRPRALSEGISTARHRGVGGASGVTSGVGHTAATGVVAGGAKAAQAPAVGRQGGMGDFLREFRSRRAAVEGRAEAALG